MSFLSAIFGSRPKVPQWNNITIGAEQQAAVGQNAAALPSIESLASGVTSYNTGQLNNLLNLAMPGWSSSVAQAGQNISSELQGKLPSDVAASIQDSDAAKALTGGFGGSGLVGNLTARDLGITSLNLTQTGQSELENWSSLLNSLYAPGQFNVSSMFIDPQTEFNDTMANQEMSWGQQWLQAQSNAMPKPEAAGLEGWLSSMGSSLTGGLLNTGGGGGGGGGGMGILSML